MINAFLVGTMAIAVAGAALAPDPRSSAAASASVKAPQKVAAAAPSASEEQEPAIDGLIRLRHFASQAMIVVLTNETDELVRTECIRKGADFFFDKSRDFERAVEAVVRFSSVTQTS